MQTTPKKVPYAPNREEIKKLYSHYGKGLVERTYAEIKQNHPLKKQPKCLTNHQFIEFMRILGLPNGFKKSDFPFLENIKIYV